MPVWYPDGKHLVYLSESDYELWWIRAEGSGQPLRILEAKNPIVPWSFSPDGRRLAYRESHSDGIDILTLPLDTSDPDHPKPGNPEPFLVSPSDKLVPMFSPDGRWIAYRSNESGRFEIYVQPFPAGAANGRSPPEAGYTESGPTTAGSCSTKHRTTASWWWITR